MPVSGVVISRMAVTPLSEVTGTEWLRAIHYGDGVFETMLWKNGGIFLAERHIRRLRIGKSTLRMRWAKCPTDVESLNEILAHHPLLQASPEFARVRLQISRVKRYHGIILLEADNLAQNPWPHAPVNLGLYKKILLAPTLLSHLKTCNALPYIVGADHARLNKWDDAVLLGPNGPAETTRANLFLIQGETVVTPPLSSGCIEGVMRGHLMEQMQKTGINLVERAVTEAELSTSDCIFLTNSVRGIMPVSDTGPLKGNPGHPMLPLLRKLAEDTAVV